MHIIKSFFTLYQQLDSKLELKLLLLEWKVGTNVRSVSAVINTLDFVLEIDRIETYRIAMYKKSS